MLNAEDIRCEGPCAGACAGACAGTPHCAAVGAEGRASMPGPSLPAQVDRLADDLLELLRGLVQELVGEVGEGACDGDLVADLGDVGVGRVAPGGALATQHVRVLRADLRAGVGLAPLLADVDLDVPVLRRRHAGPPVGLPSRRPSTCPSSVTAMCLTWWSVAAFRACADDRPAYPRHRQNG